MELGSIKPLLSALILPPTSPLLILGFGYIMLRLKNWKNTARTLIFIGFALAWLSSCIALGGWLNQALLQSYPVITAQTIKDTNTQAVVVLGGGVQEQTPEYQDTAQLGPASATRLRYGALLATQSKLPLGFSGGVGWASRAKQNVNGTEADGAKNYLESMRLTPAKWLDERSADTAENAVQMATILQPLGIKRIALVTHDWHMQRAKTLFEAEGFEVLPAPVEAIAKTNNSLLDWIPSGDGLQTSRKVLREALGLLVIKLKS